MSQKSYPGNAKMIWEAIRARRGTQLTFSRWYKGALIFEGSDATGAFSVEFHWHATPELSHEILSDIGMRSFEAITVQPTVFAGTKLSYYCWQDDLTTTYMLTEEGEWVEYGFEGKESDQ